MNREQKINRVLAGLSHTGYTTEIEKCEARLLIEELQQENEKLNHYKLLYQKVKDRNDKAIEYMKDFIFEPLLVNEDRKLIMYNANLKKFEDILKGNNEIKDGLVEKVEE